MKIVKGKLFTLEMHGYTFPVLTSDLNRAYHFFKTVFPKEEFTSSNIIHVETIFRSDTLETRYQEIRTKWNNMGLLLEKAGTILFNKYTLDLLLENNKIILTNTR